MIVLTGSRHLLVGSQGVTAFSILPFTESIMPSSVFLSEVPSTCARKKSTPTRCANRTAANPRFPFLRTQHLFRSTTPDFPTASQQLKGDDPWIKEP